MESVSTTPLASSFATALTSDTMPSASATSRPSNPRKKLRSCLSPTRTPTGYMSPARPPSSRATSFGSECSEIWRRTKSVRWEGENEGCEVTSYHHTWSAEEYDRTPLEPPSADERTCVLPARGSRCILTTYDCFSSSSSSSHEFVDDAEEVISNSSICSSPTEDISHESFFLGTPSDPTPTPHAEEEDSEDKQWEECMERRRMMFAMRNKQIHDAAEDRQPEFEGYRSISAKLVEMLRDIESRRSPSDEDEEEEDEEEEEEHEIQRGGGGFVFTNLTSLRICEVENEDEEEEYGQNTTPSLISSSESVSEMDTAIVSPRTSGFTVPSVTSSPTKKGLIDGSESIRDVEVLAAQEAVL